MTRCFSALVLPVTVLASACSLQPAYRPPALGSPSSWSSPQAASRSSQLDDDAGWWTALGDAQIDQLVIAGLRDNPSLAEVMARFDQARTALQISDAQRFPSLSADGSVVRSQDRSPTGSGTMRQTTGGLGATLNWELDLWGRLRESRVAARSRLTARTADAQGVRLSVVGEIADTALALRTCNLVLDIRNRDIRSRETELSLLRTRLSFGNVAPVAVATAQSNLANVRTLRISQTESCRRHVNALVALTGLDAPSIDALLPPPRAGQPDADTASGDLAASIAQPPPFVPVLPAIVLLGHPAIIAAEREMAARWSEIAIARAERLPRINLTAALSGQWISALGASDTYVSGSTGTGLSVPLFDGGSGAAKVRGSEAAYREAQAQLVLTVRTAIRDIEDALTAQRSALDRQQTAGDAVEAASLTLAANNARFRAGSIAQLELEDARRQFNAAQESQVVAASDRARAWVALVRRTGPSWNRPTARSGDAVGPGDPSGITSGAIIHE
jgi:NodT family efflux transporter outer membrane factor (OMF) lipoprotein